MALDDGSVIDNIISAYRGNGISDELTAGQLQNLYSDMRIGAISLLQIRAAIECICASDVCHKSELVDLLRELDRRYFLLQDLRWEFSFFDTEQTDSISEERACWLVKMVHGPNFLNSQWQNFLEKRAVSGSGVTFAELEVILCQIPSKDDLLRDKMAEERDLLLERQLRKNIVKDMDKSQEQEVGQYLKGSSIEENVHDVSVSKHEEAVPDVSQDTIDVEELARETVAMEQHAMEELMRLEQLRMADQSTESAIEAARIKHIDLKHKSIRYQLKVAIKSRNKFQLEYSVEEFKKASLEDGEMDLQEAQRLIREIAARDQLQTAMSKRDVRELERAIAVVRKNGFESRLRVELSQAAKLLLTLQRLQRIRREILELKQSTVSEIRSYHKPPAAVKTIMKATLLLLDHTDRETSDWAAVTAVLGHTGKDSIKRRCLECEPAKLNPDIVLRAKELLYGFSVESVRDVSAGAATFYLWAVTMIEEFEGISNETEES